jgi:hypothetical protein
VPISISDQHVQKACFEIRARINPVARAVLQGLQKRIGATDTARSRKPRCVIGALVGMQDQHSQQAGIVTPEFTQPWIIGYHDQLMLGV